MITLADGTIVVVDPNGTLRMRMGAKDQEGTQLNEFYHITRDGEYEDGVQLTTKNYVFAYLEKFRNTYQNCHAWCFNNGTWYSTPAVSVGYGRWTPELEKNIPMCVRMAEIVR